uniref:Uncharacterized protein n=1 Tax=Arundo donax TaxID=35708 RepID=A0A0A9FNQ0_ARUDO
MARSSGKGG